MAAAFTEPTTAYWQVLIDAADPAATAAPPWRFGVPVRLPDGRALLLPIRALPERGDRAGAPPHAVASLLVNQASLDVVEALAGWLAQGLRPLAPEVLVGLPTLGLTLAAATARALGQARYVPLGTSRKFWYEEALSAEVASITSPGQAKRIHLDPHLLPLLKGRRIALVDDAISTGSTAVPVWDLLERLGAEVVAYGVAMRQGERWRAALGPVRAAKVVGVFDSPLLQATEGGWAPRS